MPQRKAKRATLIAVGANAALLLIKASATGVSDSLTIFSETLNSLADVVASIVVVLCVYWALKHPDEDHPFGHRRAEPIAGLVVAIFAGILGFEVCKAAVFDLINGVQPERIGPWPMVALALTAVAKLVLTVYFQRAATAYKSPALRATAIDCRNDVLVAAQGLLAVVLAAWQLPLLDRVAALIVGVYILYAAHRIGMENIDYLMGHAPDETLLARIRSAADDVAAVMGVVDVRAHYVGTAVHVELTALVDGALSTTASHDVAEQVRASVETLADVDRAFVHIEPHGLRSSS